MKKIVRKPRSMRQNKLRIAEEMFEELEVSLGDFIIAISEDFRIRGLCLKLEDVTEQSEAELLGCALIWGITNKHPLISALVRMYLDSDFIGYPNISQTVH